jgi:hypothetical protein
MSNDCAPKIARRIRTRRFDDANEKCKAPNQPNQLSALFTSARPNTFNVQRHLISRQIQRQFRTAAHNSWSDATVAAA